MPLILPFVTGVPAYADPSRTLEDDAFGARYSTYQNLQRFLDQTDELQPGLIVWPGGTLAETREDRYGLEYENLFNPAVDRPGLSEMMEVARDEGTDLSIVIPTVRYLGDPEALAEDLDGFLETLLSGGYGALPDRMILEIGNEYYANFPTGGAVSPASAYGELADVAVRHIALALTDPAVNLIGADLTIAVQAGRTLGQDAEIRGELSDTALEATDMVIHHRFAYQPQGIDPRIGEVEEILDAWRHDAEQAGGTGPDLFVSGWNTVTLTREEVLDDYASDTGIDPDAVDLTGRTSTGFETYWQNRLDAAAYGQEHAAYLLESFASYAEAGMAAGALYGIDLVHPGRVSWRDDSGADHRFVPGEMLQMLYESVRDTHVLASEEAYDPDDPVTIYGFENEDKLVVFLAAGDVPPGEIVFDLAGQGTTYQAVWADRLTSELDPDWMATYGIPDNLHLNEAAEAETYAIPVREAFRPDALQGAVGLSLDDPHEIVRLAFAKTAAGAAEIAGWAGGDGTDLTDFADLPQVPVSAIPDEPDDDPQISEAMSLVADAAAGGLGGLMLLAALLMFL